MSIVRRFRTRPWPAATIVAAGLAAVLFFVPISYQKTVGQDASLTLAAPGLDRDQVRKIASEFKTALRAPDLSVTEDAGVGPVLTARLSKRSAASVARVADAFAADLTRRGIATTARVTPRTERVLRSVCAYALDSIINIDVTSDGKTPEQIAAEIRDQLEAAGIENPTVQYRREGDRTALTIEMEKSAAQCDSAALSCPEVNVTVDGRTPGDDGTAGRRAVIRVNRTAGMSDAEVIAEVERQLREQGVEAEVTIENGRIQIQPRTP